MASSVKRFWLNGGLRVGLVLALAAAARGERALQAGDALPALKPQYFEGSLPKTQGQVMLVDFWASWCAPCKHSFPELDKIYGEYKGQGLVLLAINVDDKGDAMQHFLDAHPVSFPVVRDKDHQFVAQTGVESMPTSMLVDRAGKIRFVYNGFKGEATVNELRQQIAKVLGEK